MPDVVDMNVLAFAVRQHQVGTLTFGDDAAVVKVECPRRVLRYQINGLRKRKGVVLVIRDAEGGIQQARWIIVRGEDIQQAQRGELMRRDVA